MVGAEYDTGGSDGEGCAGEVVAEAERLIEEMQSISKKVSEEMQLGSPSSE